MAWAPIWKTADAAPLWVSRDDTWGPAWSDSACNCCSCGSPSCNLALATLTLTIEGIVNGDGDYSRGCDCSPFFTDDSFTTTASEINGTYQLDFHSFSGGNHLFAVSLMDCDGEDCEEGDIIVETYLFDYAACDNPIRPADAVQGVMYLQAVEVLVACGPNGMIMQQLSLTYCARQRIKPVGEEFGSWSCGVGPLFFTVGPCSEFDYQLAEACTSDDMSFNVEWSVPTVEVEEGDCDVNTTSCNEEIVVGTITGSVTFP